MRLLAITICSFVLSLSVVAQPYYFTQGTQTYSEETGGTSVNGTTVWSTAQAFWTPIGFSFTFMGNTYDSVKVEATGRIIFDNSHYYFFDGFAVYGLRDKGTSSSQSPITAHLTGSPGNRILKIQYKNATYTGDQTATVNFQVWLHESDNALELHMGPTTINNMSGAIGSGGGSGVFNITSYSPLTYGYGLVGYGDPSATMSDSTISGTGVSTSAISVYPAPSNGDKLRYALTTSSGVGENVVENVELIKSNDGSTVIINPKYQDLEYVIYDLKGSVIRAGRLPSTLYVDVSNLKQGIYVIQVADKESKFIKL